MRDETRRLIWWPVALIGCVAWWYFVVVAVFL